MQSAWHSPKAWASLLLVMIIGFSTDIYSKSVAFEKVADSPVLLEREQLLSNPHWSPIPIHEGIVVIPGRLLNFRTRTKRWCSIWNWLTKTCVFYYFHSNRPRNCWLDIR